MSNRHSWTLLVILAVTISLSFALASGQTSAKPVKLEYGLKAGDTAVYNLNVLVEWPTETLTLSGYSIYHIKSVNSVGYISLSHLAKLAAQSEGRELLAADRAPVRSFGGGCDGVVNSHGEWLQLTGHENLPYKLGEAAFVLLPRLPQGEETSWQNRIPYAFTRKRGGGAAGAMGGPGFGPMPGAPMPMGPGRQQPGEPERQVYDENWQYTLGESSGDTVTISASGGMNTDTSTMEVKGSIVWNARQGRVESTELKYRWTIHDEGKDLIIPVTVSANIATPEEAKLLLAKLQTKWDEEDQRLKAATQRAQTQRAEDSNVRKAFRMSIEMKEGTPAELDQAMADLRNTSDNYVVRQACKKLAKTIPLDTRRAQVARALLPLLARGDIWVRQDAADALGVWGSPAELPVMKATLKKEDNTFVRDYLQDAIKDITARGEIKPPASASAPAAPTASAAPASVPAPATKPRPAGKIVYER